jgi:glucose/arabinose dehydrogenase
MKKYIIHTTGFICLMLAASVTVQAQQAKAQPEKTAAASQPAQQPVTASEAAKPVEPKTAEIKTAPAEKRMPLQNIDRPKASTIQPDNKEKPLANEGPKTPTQQQQ